MGLRSGVRVRPPHRCMDTCMRSNPTLTLTLTLILTLTLTLTLTPTLTLPPALTEAG